MKDFETIPHTADLQLRVYGTNLKMFFRNALVGMFQAIGPQAQGCKLQGDRISCDVLPHHHELSIQAGDLESLLVDFLSEALYLSDIHNEAYLDADIHQVDEKSISATIRGVRITGFDVVEIKAVTYHGLKIVHTDDGWCADIVFDI